MRKIKREYIENEMPQLSNVKLINSQNLRPKKKIAKIVIVYSAKQSVTE
jgi:hypothetical protein